LLQIADCRLTRDSGKFLGEKKEKKRGKRERIEERLLALVSAIRDFPQKAASRSSSTSIVRYFRICIFYDSVDRFLKVKGVIAAFYFIPTLYFILFPLMIIDYRESCRFM